MCGPERSFFIFFFFLCQNPREEQKIRFGPGGGGLGERVFIVVLVSSRFNVKDSTRPQKNFSQFFGTILFLVCVCVCVGRGK